jgi:hypothetical protein
MRSIVFALLVLVAGSGWAYDVNNSSVFPEKDVARKFFETTDASITPVYAVIKGEDDHVATVHGFVDNFENCQLFIEALNKAENANVFRCERLNAGTLKK